MHLESTRKKWHSADADVIMMREVLNKMILFFKKNINLDISKNKASILKSSFKKIKKS